MIALNERMYILTYLAEDVYVHSEAQQLSAL